MTIIGIALGILPVVVLAVWTYRRRMYGPGPFRVEVLETNGSTTEWWCRGIGEARAYADDAASEADWPVAQVYNADGRLVYEGEHYATR